MTKSLINAIYGMALMMTIVSFAACGGNKTTEATIEDKTEEISMQMQKEVSAMKDELAKAQMQLNDQLAKIDASLVTADDEAKMKLEEVKMKLQKESEKLNDQMAALNGELKDGWENVKSESQQLVKNIENSLKALQADM
jgi:uncharacterized phage infection (PIP) family protein YhgE